MSEQPVIRRTPIRTAVLLVATSLLFVRAASADDIRVMTSGAFTAAYLALVPQFERGKRGPVDHAATTMGTGSDSIPSRLARGEAVDIVIVADAALTELIEQGYVIAGSRVELARSSIGVAVRAGAPKPDISSVDALRHTLLRATSIAYSASVSGTYLSQEMFQHLGIADQVLSKSRRIDRERVGAVVARGEAEIGFQQISELLPEPGIDYVGPLPAEVQRVTVFSAASPPVPRTPTWPAPSSRFSPRLKPRARSQRAVGADPGEMTSVAGPARLPTFPVVLAGAAAFLDLYSTQPLSAVDADVWCVDVPSGPDDHRADGSGCDLRAVHRPARRSPRFPAGHRAVGLDPDAGHRVGRDLAHAASADLLALRAGDRDARHLREHRRVRPRSVAAVACGPGDGGVHDRTILGGFTGRAVSGLVAADVSWQAAFVALAILTGGVAAC